MNYMFLSQDACLVGVVLILSPINSYDQVSDIVIGLGKLLQHYPTLLRCVQKLGTYYGMAFRVKKLLKDPNFFKLRGNIRFIEVSFSHFFYLILQSLKDSPPSQKTFFVTRNLAQMLNDNAIKSHKDQVTLKDIELKYPNQSFSETGSVPITVSAHCELALALHTLNSLSKPKTIEIGISKRPCWKF